MSAAQQRPRGELGWLLWVGLLSVACAALPSAVPLADSSGGIVPASAGRDRRPRSDAGSAWVAVEDVEDAGDETPEDEPSKVAAKETSADVSVDAGVGCNKDSGAVTWPGDYYGSDRMTTSFEGLPPNTMTDDKAHTRVEQGRGDRIVISVIDSSKGDVMCALNATVDGASATLERGQTCFGQGDNAPDIISGSARVECDRLTFELSAATEIELEDDVQPGEIDYHFEGTRK
jgi:hypothetical protein